MSLTDTIDALFDDPERDLSPQLPEASRLMRAELAERGETELDVERLEQVIGVTVGVTVTAGFVTWLLKSGLLAAATASTTTIWRSFDPIPVTVRSPDPGESPTPFGGSENT